MGRAANLLQSCGKKLKKIDDAGNLKRGSTLKYVEKLSENEKYTPTI
jgi:hypothetical protein